MLITSKTFQNETSVTDIIDGRPLITIFKNLTRTIDFRNGTVFIRYGSDQDSKPLEVSSLYSNGTLFRDAGNGPIRTIFPNGTRIINYKNGTVVQKESNGNW